jgi:hypothetical protein
MSLPGSLDTVAVQVLVPIVKFLDSFSTVDIGSYAEKVIGPAVEFLDSLSFIGVNSHVVKLDYVVRDTQRYIIIK